MNRIYILFFILAGITLTSCKTKHFMKSKFTPLMDTSVVGLVLRYETNEDTSVISESIEKGIEYCGFQTCRNFVKKEIYDEQVFRLLLSADSSFITSQPTLIYLNQILVVNTHLIRKNDDKGQNIIWIEMLGKWISLSPIRLIHTFYYVEKLNSKGEENEEKTVGSYLSGQILKKLCIDIEQHIFKTN